MQMRAWLATFGAMVALMALTYFTTYASPITANVVGSAVGNVDEAGIEYRNGYEWDNEKAALDHRYTDRIDLFYNLSDDSQFRLFLNRVDPQNEGSDVTNVFIEPLFQVFKAHEHGFDGAFTSGLTLADGDNRPHQIRTILSATIPFGDGFFRHNSVFAHQFGARTVDGLRYEARWRFMHQVPSLGVQTELGLEVFNDFQNLRTTSGFDRGEHRAGPIATGKLTDSLGFQTGVLWGISTDAPDLATKFWLEYLF